MQWYARARSVKYAVQKQCVELKLSGDWNEANYVSTYTQSEREKEPNKKPTKMAYEHSIKIHTLAHSHTHTIKMNKFSDHIYYRQPVIRCSLSFMNTFCIYASQITKHSKYSHARTFTTYRHMKLHDMHEFNWNWNSRQNIHTAIDIGTQMSHSLP